MLDIPWSSTVDIRIFRKLAGASRLQLDALNRGNTAREGSLLEAVGG